MIVLIVIHHFANGNRQGRMPFPTLNGTAGLIQAIKNTTIGDQGLIDELNKLETYPSPSMHCAYHNGSSVTGVSNVFCHKNMTNLLQFEIL